jgi:C4-dicarboxylate-specific signal transduction histidine kinase
MEKSIFKNLWKTIKSGKIWEDEVKNLKKDGSYYWAYSKIEPIFEDGEKTGYVSTRTDITAKKEYEEQQLKMLSQAKMAAMGEMLGNIAHQWRQPLSVITSLASAVTVKKELGILDVDNIRKEMDKIIESAEYLSNTIETFRNFLASNKESKRVCMQSCIDEVLQILHTTIINEDIKVVNNANKIDKISLTMIAGELEQVMINIINNAKDVFIEKNIQERTIIINLSKEDKKLLLTIEDNAGGIPKDVLPKVFDAYFTTKHQSQGTGLGLHMSYRIINESLNGSIYVKNTDRGAKFFIELPV